MPEPAFAWALDGDAVAAIGDVDLEFSGSHDLDVESVAFDGVTGSARSIGAGLIDTESSFTVAAWVSLGQAKDYAFAVSQIGEVAAAFYLGYAKGRWSFNTKSADGPGGNAAAQEAAPRPDPTAWVHLAGVYDDAAGEIRLYVDGELAAYSDFQAKWQASGPLTIGRSQADGAPANFWPGAIADVRVYDVALNDAQVRAGERDGRPSLRPPALAQPPPGFHCSDAGGRCLGRLAAGTYTTEVFDPAITYTVPEGWTNGEDLLGNFALERDGHPGFVGIYRNISVPLPCREAPDPGVGLSVDELVDWYTSHPGLVTTDPEPVSVGGLTGVVIDVSIDPAWTEGCGWSGGAPSVGILIGVGPSSLTHQLATYAPEERIYLLEFEDGNIAIEVGADGAGQEEHLGAATPIIESLRFDK